MRLISVRWKDFRWLKISIFICAVFVCVFQDMEVGATEIEILAFGDSLTPCAQVIKKAGAKELEILAFGDSITQGVKIDSEGHKTGIASPPKGSRTGDGYEPELESLYRGVAVSAYVYNWGLGGERTDAGLNRISSVLASRQAQYILIMEGTNDILASISTATTAFNLSQMVKKSRNASIEPILATIPPITIPDAWASDKNIFAKDLNEKIKDLALNNNIVLVDQYGYLSPPDGTGWKTIYSSGDGLHLSDEGQARVAKAWFESLEAPQHYSAGLISYSTLEENGGSAFVDSTGLNDGQYLNGSSCIDVISDSLFDWGVDESFTIESWIHKGTVTFKNKAVAGRDNNPPGQHSPYAVQPQAE